MFRTPILLAVLCLTSGLTGPAHAARSPKPVASHPVYDLSALVQPEGSRLDVSGTVRLPASTEARAALLVRLHPSMEQFQVEISEPRGCEGPAEITADPTHGADARTISPRRPIPAGAPVLLRFSAVAGGSRGTGYSIAPPIAFASGRHFAWYPIFDDGVARGSGDLRFSVPAGLDVVVNAKRTGGAVEARDGIHRFAAAEPTFFSFAVGTFETETHKGRIPIAAHRAAGSTASSDRLDECGRVFDFLEDLYGPYPYASFTIVEVPSDATSLVGPDGASGEGVLFAPAGTLTSEDPRSLPRILGRQWWGGVVRPADERVAPVLEQSLPQYGAFHWIETSQGEAAVEKLRRGTPTTGARGWFLRAAAGVDEPLLGASATEDGIAIARGKGALVFDLLARTLGRDRFRAALRDLSREYAHRDLDMAAMRAAFEARGGRDLGWFFEQWFERPGAPRWTVEWQEAGGTLRGTVVQEEAPYRTEVDVQIDGPAERTLRTLALSGPRTPFEWKLGFAVHDVELDPRFRVPHWTPELRAEAEALAPVLRADRLRTAGDLDEAEALLRAALAEVHEPDLIGARFAIEHGLSRVLLEKNDAIAARSHAEEALRAPTRRADLLPWVYLDLARLAQAGGDSARARWAAQAAITAEAAAGQASGVAEEAKALLATP